MSAGLTGEVAFDHLAKVVSARTLHCKVTVFLIVTNKYLVERHFETMQLSYFSSEFVR